MSIAMMNLVWTLEVGPPARKLVLLALANAVGDGERCWPSLELLADRAGVDRSTVVRHLEALESDGLITKQRRRRQSTVYDLSPLRLKSQSKTSQVETSQTKTSQSKTSQNPAQEVAESDFPKENPKEPKHQTSSKSGRARRLPASWTPTETHRTRATALHLNLEDEAEQFRLHAEANERKLKNWDAAFTMWLIKARKILDRNRPPQLSELSEDAARAWLRVEWQAGRTKAIQDRTGLAYRPPDIPLDIDRGQLEEFLKRKAREWITANSDQIIDRLTHRSAS